MATLDWVPPQACTLPRVEQPLRVAEFDALFARHLVAVDRVEPTRARLLLAIDPSGDLAVLTASVRELTVREASCCSFFTFNVIPTPRENLGPDSVGGVILEIVVPTERADVLAVLVDRAEAIGGR